MGEQWSSGAVRATVAADLKRWPSVSVAILLRGETRRGETRRRIVLAATGLKSSIARPISSRHRANENYKSFLVSSRGVNLRCPSVSISLAPTQAFVFFKIHQRLLAAIVIIFFILSLSTARASCCVLCPTYVVGNSIRFLDKNRADRLRAVACCAQLCRTNCEFHVSVTESKPLFVAVQKELPPEKKSSFWKKVRVRVDASGT